MPLEPSRMRVDRAGGHRPDDQHARSTVDGSRSVGVPDGIEPDGHGRRTVAADLVTRGFRALPVPITCPSGRSNTPSVTSGISVRGITTLAVRVARFFRSLGKSSGLRKGIVTYIAFLSIAAVAVNLFGR
jgi:hypothetical protein